jgi:hypothetical protein
MLYPGRTIRIGESNPHTVKALKKRLNELLALGSESGLRLDPDNPRFGLDTKRAVLLFQARHTDAAGRPLKQDGQVGPLTWAALFGNESLPAGEPSSPLMSRALKIAANEEASRVREVPPNSNRGPRVDEYLRRTGTPPGHAWCCAFVYWCIDEAARQQACANPMVRTAGCLDHWNRAARGSAQRIARSHAIENPALVEPGMIFIMDHGRGLGHTGFVESISGGLLTTIEGNTDASRTREGGGVYRLTRKIAEVNKGFIAYGGA